MIPALELSRRDFLNLLADETASVSIAAAEHRSRILAGRATVVTLAAAPTYATLWLGPSHTVVASGRDPITLTSIKTANAALAVVTLLELGSRGQQSSGWWEVACRSPAGVEQISGYHRPPDATWMVTEELGRTLVRHERLDLIATRIAAVLETALDPIGASSLV